jgi:hypothetical protein
MLIVRSRLKPVDIYCYLKARFGEPNGFQNFLRRDDSDNWIHWDYSLKAGKVDVYFAGTSREIHMMVGEPLTDLQWRDLIVGIRTDYARIGPPGRSAAASRPRSRSGSSMPRFGDRMMSPPSPCAASTTALAARHSIRSDSTSWWKLDWAGDIETSARSACTPCRPRGPPRRSARRAGRRPCRGSPCLPRSARERCARSVRRHAARWQGRRRAVRWRHCRNPRPKRSAASSARRHRARAHRPRSQGAGIPQHGTNTARLQHAQSRLRHVRRNGMKEGGFNAKRLIAYSASISARSCCSILSTVFAQGPPGIT